MNLDLRLAGSAATCPTDGRVGKGRDGYPSICEYVRVHACVCRKVSEYLGVCQNKSLEGLQIVNSMPCLAVP